MHSYLQFIFNTENDKLATKKGKQKLKNKAKQPEIVAQRATEKKAKASVGGSKAVFDPQKFKALPPKYQDLTPKATIRIRGTVGPGVKQLTYSQT